MGKLGTTLVNGGLTYNHSNVSRMDAYSYTMDPIVMNDLEVTKASIQDDFYPMMKKKYHSSTPHVYKHYYSEPPVKTTYIYKKPSKTSRPHSNNDYDWFDLFGCDDDDGGGDDYSDESGSNESGGQRKRRTRNRNRNKKKKWIKILLFLAFLIAAKVCFHKMMHHYFPALDSTTGRDEEPLLHSEIYHNDIDPDFFAKTQDIHIEHRSLFSPNYDETNLKIKTPF